MHRVSVDQAGHLLRKGRNIVCTYEYSMVFVGYKGLERTPYNTVWYIDSVDRLRRLELRSSVI